MAKGLICAGGEATRLGEITRVTNKHLLPVGEWPMVYYSLAPGPAAAVMETLHGIYCGAETPRDSRRAVA